MMIQVGQTVAVTAQVSEYQERKEYKCVYSEVSKTQT